MKRRTLLVLAMTAAMPAAYIQIYGGSLEQTQQIQEAKLASPKLTLAGITSIGGNKRALLNVEYPGTSGKPGKQETLILGPGQASGSIEVVEIDQKLASVRVKNSGIVCVLTLKKQSPSKPQ